METRIRLLLAEDSADDAELLRLHLAGQGIRLEALQRVEDKEGFLRALEAGGWDLVLSDFLLPDTNGLELLRLLRGRDPDLPFLLVSGVLSEGDAVEAMRRGANDFLLKGNLSRLVPAIERELREAGSRRQRRAFEAELNLLHRAIGQTPDLVLITEPDGTLVYVNPAVEAVSGYRREELLGSNPRIFKSGNHDDAFYRTLWEVLLRGETWRGHIVNRRKDGDTWDSEMVISPVYAAGGALQGYLATARDVSHERELEFHLQQTQRLETIGVLTSGIAHDFNNILMPVVGHAELGLERPPGDPKVREDLAVILACAQRAGDLVRQILAFSHDQVQTAAPVELQLLVAESMKLLRSTVPTSIAFRLELEARNCWVTGDPTKLHQVILNLCVNAAHAMRGSAGQLTVTLRSERLAETPCAMDVTLPAGDYLRLQVRDSGRGIAAEHLDKIFLPFFTTKPPREGSGLGLSVTHSIVTALGGGIQVESQPGAGATFTVLLPVVAQPAPSTPPAAAAPARGRARILLVDDEAMLVAALQNGLQQLGFTVLPFLHADNALAALRADPAGFDLLLTDFQMPGLTGLQLAEAAWTLRPQLPAILLTGNSLALDDGGPSLERFRAVLFKPVPVAEVARAIQAVLEPAAARPGS